MICASVNRFFTSDLPFRMIGLSTEVLLKTGGRRTRPPDSGHLRLHNVSSEVGISYTPDLPTLVLN